MYPRNSLHFDDNFITDLRITLFFCFLPVSLLVFLFTLALNTADNTSRRKVVVVVHIFCIIIIQTHTPGVIYIFFYFVNVLVPEALRARKMVK